MRKPQTFIHKQVALVPDSDYMSNFHVQISWPGSLNQNPNQMDWTCRVELTIHGSWDIISCRQKHHYLCRTAWGCSCKYSHKQMKRIWMSQCICLCAILLASAKCVYAYKISLTQHEPWLGTEKHIWTDFHESWFRFLKVFLCGQNTIQCSDRPALLIPVVLVYHWRKNKWTWPVICEHVILRI